MLRQRRDKHLQGPLTPRHPLPHPAIHQDAGALRPSTLPQANAPRTTEQTGSSYSRAKASKKPPSPESFPRKGACLLTQSRFVPLGVLPCSLRRNARRCIDECSALRWRMQRAAMADAAHCHFTPTGEPHPGRHKERGGRPACCDAWLPPPVCDPLRMGRVNILSLYLLGLHLALPLAVSIPRYDGVDEVEHSIEVNLLIYI